MHYVTVTRWLLGRALRFEGPARVAAVAAVLAPLLVIYVVLVPWTVLKVIGLAIRAGRSNEVRAFQAEAVGWRPDRPPIGHHSGPPQF